MPSGHCAQKVRQKVVLNCGKVQTFRPLIEFMSSSLIALAENFEMDGLQGTTWVMTELLMVLSSKLWESRGK